MATEIGGMPIIFGDSRQPKCLPLDQSKARREEFKTESIVLPKGHIRRSGCLTLPCDILFERDQPVTLHDGTTIYTDIYRPVDATLQCPAILAWSPYGKAGGKGTQILDDFPFRFGVPLSELSELQKWEGPDPAYWVLHGYAVINPDPRGIGNSEGDAYCLGSQEARDATDLIDWVGEREWCSGKVGMSGNSYLAAIQWAAAAQKPKYLAAIAPWEGISDILREGPLLGGIESKATLGFVLKIMSMNVGLNSWENVVAMALKHKVHSAYHLDKAPAIESIEVPAYVVASYTNTVHVFGTFRAYTRLRSPKWLRVHDTIEWPDYYAHENVTDLHRFFDRYLKDVSNDWETTPTVRAQILDTANPLPGTGEPIVMTSFPPSSTESRPLTLFFAPKAMTLSPTFPLPGTASYTNLPSATTNGLTFTHTFASSTTLFGPIDLHLTLSLPSGTGDADLYIYVSKVLASGRIGEQLTIPFPYYYQTAFLRTLHWSGLAPATKVAHYRGPKGYARVSRRALDPVNTTPGLTVPDLSRPPQEVEEHEVVVMRPCIEPIGMHFQAGESLQLRISAQDERALPPVERGGVTLEGLEELNRGGEVKLRCEECCVRIPMLK